MPDVRRQVSLDAFRGLTIAGMVVVNNPGSWKHVFPPLRHAEWNGWTPTDLVFPFFLFIVGVSISLALSKRTGGGRASLAVLAKIFRRSLILFLLGIGLHLFHRFNWATLRIPGVLQRIAVCYLVSALLFVKTRPATRAVIAFALLAVYYAAMKWIPVPGVGAGVWEPGANLCGWLDTKLLAGHLYLPNFDPEGILSTVPAMSTTLLGTMAGDWLRSSAGRLQKSLGLVLSGAVLIAAGLLLHPYFPINKQLWTSSFVLFSGGAALVFLGLCSLLTEALGFRRWSFPFLVLGRNAIVVYVGSSVLVKLMSMIRIRAGTGPVDLKTFIYNRLLVPWAGPGLGSLVFPLLLLLLWIALLWPLYKRRIFIKI